MRALSFHVMVVLLVVLAAAMAGGVSVAQQGEVMQAEAETYTTELAAVSLSGLQPGSQYVLTWQPPGFKLSAYAGIELVSQDSEGLQFIARSPEARLFLRAPEEPGSYDLTLQRADGSKVGSVRVEVKPISSRGEPEPDAAADSVDELLVALASSGAASEVLGYSIQSLGAGGDGVYTVYLVGDVEIEKSIEASLDLSLASAPRIVIVGAYGGVAGAYAELNIMGEGLLKLALAGPSGSGIELRYIGLLALGSIEVDFEGEPELALAASTLSFSENARLTLRLQTLTTGAQPPKDAPALRLARVSGSLSVAVIVDPGPQPAPLPYTLYKASFEDSPGLRAFIEAPGDAVAIVVVDRPSHIGGLEVAGGVLLAVSPNASLKVEGELRFTATEPATQPIPLPLPLQGLVSSNVIYSQPSPSSRLPQRVLEAQMPSGSNAVIEAVRLVVDTGEVARSPEEMTSRSRGYFVMLGVDVKAGEVLVGWSRVSFEGGELVVEASRPSVALIAGSSIYATYVEIAPLEDLGLGSIELQPTGENVIVAENVVLRGSRIMVSHLSLTARDLTVDPIVDTDQVSVTMNALRLAASKAVFASGFSEMQVAIDNSVLRVERVEFRGFVDAVIGDSLVEAAEIAGGGETPLGGRETRLTFAGGLLAYNVAIRSLEYPLVLDDGEVYVVGRLVLEGVKAYYSIFETTSTLYLEANGVEGSIAVNAHPGATMAVKADSPGLSIKLSTIGLEEAGYIVIRETVVKELSMRYLGNRATLVISGPLKAETFKVSSSPGFSLSILGVGDAVVEADLVDVRSESITGSPGEVMTAGGELVVKGVSFRAKAVTIGYAAVTVEDDNVKVESARPSRLVLEEVSIEASRVMVGGDHETLLRGVYIEAGTLVMGGQNLRYNTGVIRVDTLIVNPLVFNVEAAYEFLSVELDAKEARFICGPTEARIVFKVSEARIAELTTAGRVEVTFQDGSLSLEEAGLGLETPGGGGLNRLVVEVERLELPGGSLKVYSSRYPAEVLLNVLLPGGSRLYLESGEAALRVNAEIHTLGPLTVEASSVEGTLTILVGGGGLDARVSGEVSLRALVEPGATAGIAVKAMEGALVSIEAGPGSRVKAKLEAEGSRGVEFVVGPEAWVGVSGRVDAGYFKAVTPIAAMTPSEVMDASGTLVLRGLEARVESDFVAGYAMTGVEGGKLRVESSRPGVVEVEGSKIRAGGVLMVGGVYGTVVEDSELKGSVTVIRGSDIRVEGSVVEATEELAVNPVVFGATVKALFRASTIKAPIVKYLCGSSKAIVGVVESTLGSIEEPVRIYAVGMVNFYVYESKLYLSGIAGGLETPLGAGEVLNAALVNSEVEGGDVKILYGPLGLRLLVAGGSINVEGLSVEPEGEGGFARVTLAPEATSLSSCAAIGDAEVYAIGFECPGAILSLLPEGARSYAALIPPGAGALGPAEGFDGPLAAYLAYWEGEGYTEALVAAVNLSYQPQRFTITLPSPGRGSLGVYINGVLTAVAEAIGGEARTQLDILPAEAIVEPLTITITPLEAPAPITVTTTITVTETMTETVTEVETRTIEITSTAILTETLARTYTRTLTVTSTETITYTTIQTVTTERPQPSLATVALVIGVLLGGTVAFIVLRRGAQ